MVKLVYNLRVACYNSTCMIIILLCGSSWNYTPQSWLLVAKHRAVKEAPSCACKGCAYTITGGACPIQYNLTEVMNVQCCDYCVIKPTDRCPLEP